MLKKNFFTFCSLILLNILFVNSLSRAHAVDGLKFGVSLQNNNITNAKESFFDYNLIYYNAEIPIYNYIKNDASSFAKINLGTTIFTEYSFFFTESLGIGTEFSYGYGNLQTVELDGDKINEKINRSNIDDDKKISIPGGKEERKLMYHSLELTLLLKYDILGNTTKYIDYGRSGYSLVANLGPLINFLVSKDISTEQKMTNIYHEGEKAILPSEMINLFNFGIRLSVDFTTPINLGFTLGGTAMFMNIFREPDIANKKQSQDVKNKNSKLELIGTFKQKSMRFSEFVEIYFDFAPFINNYEEKQEIDIEKW